MIDAEKDFELKPGDELIQCNKGFTCNMTTWTGSHVPSSVVVVREYPRFILCKMSFKNTHGEEYYECINKGAVIAGDCYFKKWDKNNYV